MIQLEQIQVPEVGSLLEVPDGDIYQLCPTQEAHNTQEPHKCWCFPQVTGLTDEEGKTYIVIVQHQWEM